MSSLPDGLEPIDPLAWRTIIARCLLGSTVKLVALTMANYASGNGADVRPGEKLLAKDTQLGIRTVRDAMTKLREVGLTYRTFEASALGLADKADEYQLTIPPDLEGRVPMWDPKRRKVTLGGIEQAPPAPHKRAKKEKVPAADAGTGPVDSEDPPATDAGAPSPEEPDERDETERLLGGNHRQVITEPPATDSRTTGNSCRPPSHRPSHSPSQDAHDPPYGAELEGKPASARKPSADDSQRPSYRQPPILVAVPAFGPAPSEYETARDRLARLPDLGHAALDAARAELPDGTPLTQVVIHAAYLAWRTA